MKKSYCALLLALVLTTAILAINHLNNRADAEPGTLLVLAGERRIEIDIGELEHTAVQGTIVNGRGEARTIETEGVALVDVLDAAEVETFEAVRVVAADEYSATVAAEELITPGKVWLIQEEASVRMIVFGDADSRRDVKHVERIEVK